MICTPSFKQVVIYNGEQRDATEGRREYWRGNDVFKMRKEYMLIYLEHPRCVYIIKYTNSSNNKRVFRHKLLKN